MTDTPPDHSETIRRLEALIATARNHLAAGRSVDLATLGQRMEELCRSIEAHPPEDRSDVQAGLRSLEADLDDLEKDLVARQDAHTEPLHEAAHRKAVRTYRKPSGKK